jgi:hypothetical protein
MSDVRLTATNPEDSSVVPVACNEKGELKLEEPILTPPFDGNLDGDLTVSGTAVFEDNVSFLSDSVEISLSSAKARLNVRRAATGNAFAVVNSTTLEPSILFLGNGTATFDGDVVVGSRGKRWKIIESGGLAHLTEVESRDTNDTPELRNVFSELDTIEKALEEVMVKLRMVEEDGWPVWDGSNDSR